MFEQADVFNVFYGSRITVSKEIIVISELHLISFRDKAFILSFSYDGLDHGLRVLGSKTFTK